MGFKAGNWICLILFFIVAGITVLKIREWHSIYDSQPNCCFFSTTSARGLSKIYYVPNSTYTPEYFSIQNLRWLMIILFIGAIPSGAIDLKKLKGN